MSQNQSSTPNQPPNNRPSIILAIVIVLVLLVIILGIYAILAKQETVNSIILFVIALSTVFIGIQQVAPSLFSHVRRSLKMSLLIIGILLLMGSLSLNGYLLVHLGTSSNPNVNAPTLTAPKKTPTQAHLTPTSTATPTQTPPSIPTLVQKNFFAESHDTNSSTVTFPMSVTTGDLIVVAITHFQGPVSGVMDNHGNTYTQVTVANHANASTDYAQLYYAKNAIGGTTIVTSSAGGNVGIYEYSGLDKTSPLDQVTSNVGHGVTPNGGILNTTKDNELYFVVGVDDDGGNISLSVGSGYTLENQQDDSTHHERFYAEDRISAHGSYPTDFSIAVGSNWAVIGASFKPA